MPLKLDYTANDVLTKDVAINWTVAPELLSGDNTFLTRTREFTLGFDKSASPVADGFDYDVYFSIDSDNSALFSPWMAADGLLADDFYDHYTKGDDFISLYLTRTDPFRTITIWAELPEGTQIQQETWNTFVANNLYRANVARSGLSVVVLLYDEDGGESGTPGSLIKTFGITAAVSIPDMVNLYGISAWLDSTAGAAISGSVGPLWDNNAFALAVVPPGLLTGRVL